MSVLGSDPFAVARTAAEKRKASAAVPDSDANIGATDGGSEGNGHASDRTGNRTEERPGPAGESIHFFDVNDINAQIQSV